MPTAPPDLGAVAGLGYSRGNGNPILQALESIAVVLLAPECPICRLPLERVAAGPVCPACWGRVSFITPPLCDSCGNPLPSARQTRDGRTICRGCVADARAVDRARSVGTYDGALRDLVHLLKYGARRSLARRLGDLLARSGADLVAGADISVPVPLHWGRRWARGFNQAAELAARLPLPVVHALVRVRRTRPQADLSATAREANVRDAFGLSWRLRVSGSSWRGVTRTPPLRDAVVVLVDDVSTTGATLEACARVLKRAGAREVRALTVARTPRVR
ncbi:MAG: ComF family protein [Acidobacteriota bacterium]